MDLGRDVVGRVSFEDSRLRLDDLAERPHRDPVAVRETVALSPRDELLVVLYDPAQLVDEPTLADSGDADERQELRRSVVARPVEDVANDPELTVTTDQVRPSLVCEVDAEPGVRGNRLPHRDRLGLALGLDRRKLSVVDRMPCRTLGRLVHDHAVDGRGALQARSRVDDVP